MPDKDRLRSYYLNTTRPATALSEIQALLLKHGLAADFSASERQGFVIIVPRIRPSFETIDESQRLQKVLQTIAPVTFSELAVGVVETRAQLRQIEHPPAGNAPGDFTKEAESHMAHGKHVILAVRDPDEREVLATLLGQMGMVVSHAATGKDVIRIVEDESCDCLILDIQLPDLHAWTLLGTLKEIVDLYQLPTLVVMDEQSVIPLDHVTAIVRPVAITRLRLIIQNALTDLDRS